MEILGIKALFKGVYAGKTVLVTGHTGFKGSWLTLWLIQLGANVVGYSLDIPTDPNHYKLLKFENNITHIHGDVRDKDRLRKVFDSYKPDIIFHLAAQSLVRPSYESPLTTFSTNVMGTANVFEVSRLSDSVLGIVNVTSDKCYENFEDDRPYKEEDRMGGYDPYSASKGAAELVANSYRSSFFNTEEYGIKHKILLASVRAGNVIGGGDWSINRLIPDIIKAASQGATTSIRSPFATRPWQHVLEPLSGYLLIGQQIIEGNKEISDGWNFGPANNETKTVEEVITLSSQKWDKVKFQIDVPEDGPHEANLLRLDCTKVINNLKWLPVWDAEECISKTILWYKAYYVNDRIDTLIQLQDYIEVAISKKYVWT